MQTVNAKFLLIQLWFLAISWIHSSSFLGSFTKMSFSRWFLASQSTVDIDQSLDTPHPCNHMTNHSPYQDLSVLKTNWTNRGNYKITVLIRWLYCMNYKMIISRTAVTGKILVLFLLWMSFIPKEYLVAIKWPKKGALSLQEPYLSKKSRL